MAFPILDLIAGMIFIYFLLAIVNNSCLELFSSITRARSVHLIRWIKLTFGSASNSMLSSLSGVMGSPIKTLAYIDPKDFARAVVMQLIASEKTLTEILSFSDGAKLSDNIDQSGYPTQVKFLLKTFVMKATTKVKGTTDIFRIQDFEVQIEIWFNISMRYLTEGYKRKVVNFTFVFATAITLALNIDTLQLASYLYSNHEMRQQLADVSYANIDNTQYAKTLRTQTDTLKMVNCTPSTETMEPLDKNYSKMQLPFGWPDPSIRSSHFTGWIFIKKVGGLFITIMAICLGAPFWFDVLGKIANLRSSLKPIEELNQKDL